MKFRIKESFLNALYPRCCPICHQILKEQNWLICPKCESELKPIGEPRCKKCGKRIFYMEKEYCQDCSRREHVFDEGRGIFDYDEKMRTSILKYKDGGRREYGDFYARAMIRYGRIDLRRWRPQAVLSVPIHPKKQRIRGFDQAGHLAKAVAEATGLPLCCGYMRKKSVTSAQKSLEASMRRKNVENSFEGREGDWQIRRLLVIDDVYTTGSTIDAVSVEAKRHGVENIYFLTVCIGRGD